MKTQTCGGGVFTSRDLGPVSLEWGLKTCIITNSLVMLKLLALEPHFKDNFNRRVIVY